MIEAPSEPRTETVIPGEPTTLAGAYKPKPKIKKKIKDTNNSNSGDYPSVLGSSHESIEDRTGLQCHLGGRAGSVPHRSRRLWPVFRF